MAGVAIVISPEQLEDLAGLLAGSLGRDGGFAKELARLLAPEFWGMFKALQGDTASVSLNPELRPLVDAIKPEMETEQVKEMAAAQPEFARHHLTTLLRSQAPHEIGRDVTEDEIREILIAADKEVV